MSRKMWPAYMELIVSVAMIFSMGCLFGADHPDIPFILWIVLIFVGAGAKVWPHPRIERLQQAIEQEESATSEDEAHGS